ncbi:MAG: histidinol-phosphate transaminase [Candidatus Helarchaeota archaeon]
MTKFEKYKKLLSSYLKNFEPYAGEISIPMLAEELGIPPEAIIKVDANENDFIDKNWLKNKLIDAIETIDITRYPDPQSYKLRNVISTHEKVEIDEIIMGNGTDDLIDCIIRMFLDHKSDLIVIEPTFSMYKYSSSMIGASYTPVLLNNDFSLNIDKIISNIKSNTKLIFICSPNNPTGNQFLLEKIIKLLESTDRIVVVDEAYVDFAKYSLTKDAKLTKKFDNLIVLKSYSKSWGLAGIRAGYAIGNSEIISYLRSIRKVYNFNIIAQALLFEMYKDYDYIMSIVSKIKKEREWMISKLKEIDGIHVYPSETNFVMLKLLKKDITIKELVEKFFKNNILIRDRSNLPLLENCFRITISRRDTNLKILNILNELLS